MFVQSRFECNRSMIVVTLAARPEPVHGAAGRENGSSDVIVIETYAECRRQNRQ